MSKRHHGIIINDDINLPKQSELFGAPKCVFEGSSFGDPLQTLRIYLSFATTQLHHPRLPLLLQQLLPPAQHSTHRQTKAAAWSRKLSLRPSLPCSNLVPEKGAVSKKMSSVSLETCPSSAAFFGYMGVASSMVFGSEYTRCISWNRYMAGGRMVSWVG